MTPAHRDPLAATPKPVKLTPLQQEALNELDKPDNKAHFSPYMGRFGGAYWFISSNFKRCTKQIEVLIRVGYLKENRGNGYNKITATITEEGRKHVTK